MAAAVPDPRKVAQCRKAPEQGPRILFFSGGTALRRTSRELIRLTRNSIHLITSFDSGGSSAVLRKGFAMPAVGDIRNRLMALSDLAVDGNSEIFALFTHRLPKGGTQADLLCSLRQMVEGKHVLVHWIPDPKRAAIQKYLSRFLDLMPDDFDLRGASIGNLVLTAGYLDNGRRMGGVIDTFSQLASVGGIVRPIVEDDLHLAARLADGTTVVGQHLLTGKEAEPLVSPMEGLWLASGLEDATPAAPEINREIRTLISGADLICYPVGSFYTSILANLLPGGVGGAVAGNSCAKVFVPNTGHDPEVHGLSIVDQITLLRERLVASGAPSGEMALDRIVVDSENGIYEGGLDLAAVEKLGVEVVDVRLITPESAPYLDGRLLSEALVSMA